MLCQSPRGRRPDRLVKRITLKLIGFLGATAAASATHAQGGDYLGALWGLCPVDPPAAQRPLPSRGDFEPGTIELTADGAELIEDGLSTFTGNVEAMQDDLALAGDKLVYDPATRFIDLTGNAYLWGPNLIWSGERAHVDIDADVSTLRRGYYRMLESRGHGRAEVVVDEGRENLTKLRKVDYTTCPIGTRQWKLEVGNLRLDHETERGSGTNVWLTVKDVPVFYLPYISFPLTDKRKTGLLVPSFASSQKHGIDITVPWYWNIAPDYDATLAPRYLEERGIMLEGEFRYLLDRGLGQINLNYLPDDDKNDSENRSLFQFRHRQVFAQGRALAYADYNHVSDPQYFEDFGNALGITSQQFLQQRGDLRYQGNGWSALARVQNYQRVDPSISGGPYKRLPQLAFTRNLLPVRNRALNAAVQGDATYFDRDDSVVGGRFDLKPSLSYPYRTASGFVIPKIATQLTQYALSDDPDFPSSPSRVVPMASLDAGLFFERKFDMFDDRYVQTLEPRIYYLYVHETDQDDIPVFDTGVYDFTFAQLFREDRFSGRDRVGDANQVTLALTSRLFDSMGGVERFQGSIGQIYYLEDRDVTLPGREVNDNTLSEMVGEASLRIARAWRLRGGVTWDPETGDARRSTLGLRYAPSTQAVVNLGYRLRRDLVGIDGSDVEQVEASARWPLNPHWSVIGRWVHSVEGGNNLETVGGIEYDSCCWAVRAVGRRFLTTSEAQYDTGVAIQIELKGLAGIGRNTSSFLERNVPGYESQF